MFQCGQPVCACMALHKYSSFGKLPALNHDEALQPSLDAPHLHGLATAMQVRLSHDTEGKRASIGYVNNLEITCQPAGMEKETLKWRFQA